MNNIFWSMTFLKTGLARCVTRHVCLPFSGLNLSQFLVQDFSLKGMEFQKFPGKKLCYPGN
jgi:hypothetical protein